MGTAVAQTSRGPQHERHDEHDDERRRDGRVERGAPDGVFAPGAAREEAEEEAQAEEPAHPGEGRRVPEEAAQREELAGERGGAGGEGHHAIGVSALRHEAARERDEEDADVGAERDEGDADERVERRHASFPDTASTSRSANAPRVIATPPMARTASARRASTWG